jgi:hypothetical protein
LAKTGTALIDALKGLRCINIRLIVGGTLILYFDADHENSSAQSNYILTVEPAWRLHLNSSPLMGSFDTPTERCDVERWLTTLRGLIGKTVSHFQIGCPICDLTISFEDGFCLQTFAHSVEDGENWELKLPDGRRIGMMPGNPCDLTQSKREHESS